MIEFDFSLIKAVTLEVIQSLFMVSSPAIVVEAAMYEMEQIKKTLISQLLPNSDESVRFELETVVQYVSLRPFKYTICRSVPLNIHLPFIITSICITYVIVMMQLTHFSV